MILSCLPQCLDFVLYILNYSTSLSTNIFPSTWKQSVVIPIPKNNNFSSPSSFCPISIPPFLSKLLECICFNQLNDFFRKCNAVPECQSGFRGSHNTTTELLHLSNAVLHSFDSGLLISLIAFDFSKFNTIDHELLLLKLHSCNVGIIENNNVTIIYSLALEKILFYLI